MSTMEGVELHSAALEGLCGSRLSKERVTYQCAEHTSGLTRAFLVDVSKDKAEVHPARFCNNCYRACKQHSNLEREGKDYNYAIQVQQWSQHTTDCNTCNIFTNSKKGGRPRKQTKNRGRSPTHTAKVTRAELRNEIRSLAGPQYKGNMPLSPARFVSLVNLKNLVCPMCNCAVDQPVETCCSHLLCAECLCRWLDMTRSAPVCPVCSNQLENTSSICTPSPIVQKTLMELQVHCDNAQHGCRAVPTLGQLREHVSKCHQPYTRVQSPEAGVALPPATELEPATILQVETPLLPPVPGTPPRSLTLDSATPVTLTPTKISAILRRPITTPLSRSEKGSYAPINVMPHFPQVGQMWGYGGELSASTCPRGGAFVHHAITLCGYQCKCPTTPGGEVGGAFDCLRNRIACMCTSCIFYACFFRIPGSSCLRYHVDRGRG